MNNPTSHYLKSDVGYLEPVKIHYLTYGKEKNPPVLCSHSLTGNAHDFDFLARTLAQDFFVIAPDMPGRGLTSHLKNKSLYSNDHYLSWTMEVLDHLNINELNWVGASMGGIMGMMACAAYPFMVRSLMLNDVGSVLAKEGLEDILRYTGQRKTFPDNAAFEANLREHASAFAFETEEQWKLFFQHRVKKNADGKYTLLSDPVIIDSLRELSKQENGIEDIDLTMVWDAVRCPVLLFRGQHSLLLRKHTALEMRESFGKDVTLHEVPNAGHMPNLMTVNQTTTIYDWLKKQQ
jgi:pimeloyl-ACP methyl ester carboxylesterase